MQKAQGRYEQLTSKDHTHGTLQAELQQDQAEAGTAGPEDQDMRTSAQDQLDKMQTDMLRDITQKIRGFWRAPTARPGTTTSSASGRRADRVGNEGLDITSAVVVSPESTASSRKGREGRRSSAMREGSGGSGWHIPLIGG
ncbi:MAG: hypothetical protein IPH00_15940 [Flavobacteriales bacterium]|nr:hypothetical protein [Flavobacteriales bacterium]